MTDTTRSPGTDTPSTPEEDPSTRRGGRCWIENCPCQTPTSTVEETPEWTDLGGEG